jgi:NAD(P)-dependent dehydrogenase (short-subunit alcohol dehydrogenase family)
MRPWRSAHQVVATSRRPEQVEKTLGGPQDNLLVLKLDIATLEDPQAAGQAAVDRFGRLDVLVNNAGTSPSATSRRSTLRCIRPG